MFRALLTLLFTTAVSAQGNDTALLREVAEAWLDESGRWAFTQRVREYEGNQVKQERVERFDPSRGDVHRWLLVSIDGRTPTDREQVEFQKRKNKKRRKKDRPGVAENFDFANAKLIAETPRTAVYELPLRSSVEWLFPISKVELLVKINKTGPALEQVQARIGEPFRVALGIARILDVDLDVQMAPPPQADPADARPSGTANVVVTRFGERVEYAWSDFERVIETPDKSPATSGE